MTDHASFYRAKWMTDSQWDCACALADLFGGFHHITPRNIREANPRGIQYSTPQSLSTFDFSLLTFAVLMAHERAIRIEVAPSGPRLIKLYLHKRGREGGMSERHPDLSQALESFKKSRAALQRGEVG